MKAPTADKKTRLARGARLRAMRKAADLSQSQLAESMSARYSVSRFETGVRDPGNMTLGMASHLAAALNMDVDTFARTLLDIPAWPTIPPRRYETLRRRLNHLGHDNAWLAAQAGLTPSQISKYLNGTVYMPQLSLERATLLAQTVHASLTDLEQW